MIRIGWTASMMTKRTLLRVLLMNKIQYQKKLRMSMRQKIFSRKSKHGLINYWREQRSTRRSSKSSVITTIFQTTSRMQTQIKGGSSKSTESLVRFRVYMSRAPSFTTRILSTPFRFSAMFYPTKINMMSTLIFLMVRSRKALSKSFSRRNLSDSPWDSLNRIKISRRSPNWVK